MNKIKQLFITLYHDKRGVSAIEYAVLAAIIVGLLVTAFGGSEGLSSIIEQTFNSIKEKITALTSSD